MFEYAYGWDKDRPDIFVLVDYKTGALIYISKDAQKTDSTYKELQKENKFLNMLAYHAYEDTVFDRNVDAIKQGALTYSDVMDYRIFEKFCSRYVFVVKGKPWTEDASFIDFGIFSDMEKATQKATQLMKPYEQLDEIEIHQIELNGDKDFIAKKYKMDEYGRFVKVKGE